MGKTKKANGNSINPKVVWKYKLQLIWEPQALALPLGAKIVHVEFSRTEGYSDTHYVFWLWCEVPHVEAETIKHIFQIFGTGDGEIPQKTKHVHTGIEWLEDHRNRRVSPRSAWHLYQYPVGAVVEGLDNG